MTNDFGRPERGSHNSNRTAILEYASSLLIERFSEQIKTGELVLLKSHALLKAEAKDSIKKSQIIFIVQRIINGLLNVLENQSNLENWLRQIISKLQFYSPQESGYATENILSLLCQLQTN